MLYHRFQTFSIRRPCWGVSLVSHLLGGLVLGDLVTLAGVSDLVSTTRGVHALKGLALLESGSGGGLLAAVDGGVLANAVDLVLTKLDGVVRLGSVARHDCGFG